MAFGISLIAFGGYSLGCIFFLIIFQHVLVFNLNNFIKTKQNYTKTI